MAVVMAVVLVCLIVVGANQRQPVRPPIQLTPGETPTQAGIDTAGPSSAPQLDSLAAAITGIEGQRGVSIGLGIAPVSSPGRVAMRPWQGGTLESAPAWRTIDIPIALAVSLSPRQPQDLAYLLDRSIAQDSMAGDEALWQFLGTPSQAVASTIDVLRTAGDVTTVLPEDSADPFAVFSQVWWTQADAAQFMGVLFCMPRSWPVLSHMTPGSSDGFGLAALSPTLVRTSYGAGNDSAGMTVGVRQIGLLRLEDGNLIGISLAVIADDGTLDTATAAMTTVAAMLPNVTGFDGGC